jgi:hypothetical protein
LITRRAQVVAVVLSVADYERMTGRFAVPLVDFLTTASGTQFDLPERDRSDVRDTEF